MIALVFFGTVFVAGPVAAQSPFPVTTYHYDTLRTGWNNQETTLTPANVGSSSFGVLGKPVALDDQVDAQPLIVANLTIAGGPHDVVYVATESNTIYAIDASSGAVLLSRNLGTPVFRPLGCGNNGRNVGITGTPVIDLTAQTLYLIAYVKGSPPIYQLHALDLSTLADKGNSPVKVAASHKLSNGASFTFDATFQRQRPALLELNGNVYAAFGSFCDFKADHSRGWLLGWNASTLLPLAGNQLDDTQVTCPGPAPCSSTRFFLSSIWMSGYGIGGTGTQLYFSTGNSDGSHSARTTYDGVTNIQESVVKLEGDLTHHLLGIFTPSNVASMDKFDSDLGSGGVLLLPDQAKPFVHLAVVGAKDGRLFLLNRDKLGGFTPRGPNKVLDTHQLPKCWCGPSFFTGSDQIGRVVTSQGSSLQTWQLKLSPSPKLVLEGTASIATGQDHGFFTSVSSNGTTAGTAIIWAVGRPTDPKTTFVNLYAFAATASGGTLPLLFGPVPAGSWPNTAANANIVPVVANGKVYVAANKSLTIFGIPSTRVPVRPPVGSPVAPLDSPHVISGTLEAVDGSTLTLRTRNGKSVKIDDSQASRNEQIGTPLDVGVPLTVQGSLFDAIGLQATSIVRAKGSSGELWPPDIP